jgi:acetyltransferase-like isoleucine patch superfamily enzyme
MNAEVSNTSFRLRRADLGGRNFLGNNIAYPPGARTGENCLLATKVMVPIDGEVRHGVGLLGSPAFEIPRTVERDRAFDDLKQGYEHRRRLLAKNRHNTATVVLFLLAQLVNLHVLATMGMVALDLYFEHGFWVVPVAAVAGLTFSIGFQILLERAVMSFRAMSPQFCSIYDPYFWRHERFWKMSVGGYLALFNGTPMKNVVWRLLGVRIGRRVFDDGCAIPEKTLVHIGDDAALNAGSVVQAHSLEDGAFKSDHIVIGPGVTVGPRGFVHYGVTMHDGAVLDADAFLMKGQETPAFTRWRGNPAAETRDPYVAPPESRSPAALVATLALAALIVVAVPAGVATALAPRSVAPPVPAVPAPPPAPVPVQVPSEASIDDEEVAQEPTAEPAADRATAERTATERRVVPSRTATARPPSVSPTTRRVAARATTTPREAPPAPTRPAPSRTTTPATTAPQNGAEEPTQGQEEPTNQQQEETTGPGAEPEGDDAGSAEPGPEPAP